MSSWIIAGLLTCISYQLYRLGRRGERAIYLLASIKLHVREAKEEHWAQLYAIRAGVMALVESSDEMDKDATEIITDLPSDYGDNGRWWYHMPDTYFEKGWARESRGAAPADDDAFAANGRRESAQMLLREMGIGAHRD